MPVVSRISGMLRVLTEVGGCEGLALGCSGSPGEFGGWDTGALGGEVASLLW